MTDFDFLSDGNGLFGSEVVAKDKMAMFPEINKKVQSVIWRKTMVYVMVFSAFRCVR